MFNDVHFTGTINLGNLVNSVVLLIGAIALYFRIKAELASHEQKTGQKIETSIRKRLTRARKTEKLQSTEVPNKEDDPNGQEKSK